MSERFVRSRVENKIRWDRERHRAFASSRILGFDFGGVWGKCGEERTYGVCGKQRDEIWILRKRLVEEDKRRGLVVMRWRVFIG